jgi:hypothetical protein
MSADRRKDLQKIAASVMLDLEGHLQAMQKAKEQLLSGRAIEDIDDLGYRLYMARRDPKDKSSRAEAILCTLDFEEYYGILEKAARDFGLCLEDETEIEVTLPDAEFEENMITGGFEEFKGLSVEHHNECLEELMVAVCRQIQKRGLAVACVPDEDVIFYLPLTESHP